MNHNLIAIVGPNASGKTRLSLKLAKKFNAEIISADSRQVYRGLDTGAGKVTKSEQRQVSHHLIDIANPKRAFTVVQFQRLAKKAINKIIQKGRIPMIVGGTGLYIESILYDRKFPQVPPNLALRKKLEKMPATKLFAMLKKMDPDRAKTIEKKNPRRLIRAIEIAKTLGSVPPSPLEGEGRVRGDTLILGIKISPTDLRRNINRRLDARVPGIIREIKKLRRQGVSFKRLINLGLEYRYFSWYLMGRLTHEETISQLKTAIWRYAKRQYTWFRRLPVVWIKNQREAEREIKKYLSLRGL